MKFNRLALIERLQANVKASQTRYERELSEWESALGLWNVSAAEKQFTILRDFNRELTLAVAKVQNMNRPLIGDELPKVPNMTRSSWSNEPFEIPIPHKINDVQYPTAPDIRRVEAFIEALKLMLDEEVSSSGIEALGHRDTLRAWL